MPQGPEIGVSVGNSPVTENEFGESRPMLPRRYSVNHRLPSGPRTMSFGCVPAVSVISLCGWNRSVTRPILSTFCSV